jgi:hypothetical protein
MRIQGRPAIFVRTESLDSLARRGKILSISDGICRLGSSYLYAVLRKENRRALSGDGASSAVR